MSWVRDRFGRLVARYIDKPAPGYEPLTPSDLDALTHSREPGDVLLVEGNNHIVGVIKYLTQSTWPHAALYVGPLKDKTADGEAHALIEAEIGFGVASAPLSKYFRFHTRICRSALRRMTATASAATRSTASGSIMTSRIFSTCCAICCRCRYRSGSAAA